jgi:hypothetical protein
MQELPNSFHRRSNRSWMLSVVVAIAILAAACGGSNVRSSNPNPTGMPANNNSTTQSTPTSDTQSSSTNSTTSKVDACTLLTKDDVSKALALPVDEATSKGLGGVCSYTTKALSIDLTVIHTGGTKFMQDTRAKLGENALDVPGVGDEAFYNTNSYTLFVRKGDALYMLFLVDSTQELTTVDRQAKEKALAEQLLSHNL